MQQRLRRWLLPWVEIADRRGITPNQLSLANLALAALVGLLLALFPGARLPLLLLTTVVLARLALDLLDGMLARAQGSRSPLGILLNDSVEPLGAILLYLPLALHPGVDGWLVVLLVALGLCAEIVALSAAQISGRRHTEGPFGKRDRAIFFALIGLILALDRAAAPWLPWLLVPALLLSLLTIGMRMRAALRAAAAPPARLRRDANPS
jgi:CDP-diacylglycerol--glycerol-3-phosphate 3-phosphatidyltransferase